MSELTKYLREDFKTHVMREIPCRTFSFRRASGGSCYAFNLTWSQGTLTISGDIGEMIITHYVAMPTFNQAVQWVSTSDIAYLLGKSNQRVEFCREETVKQIIRDANLPIIQAINGQKSWDGKKTITTGLRKIKEEVRAGRADEEEIEDYDVYFFEEQTEQHIRAAFTDETPHRYFRFSEEWDGWVSLWKNLIDFGLGDSNDSPEIKKILSARYRRKMRRAIDNACWSEHEAAEFLRFSGYDDLPIYRDYTFNQRRMAAAVKWGCQKIISEGIVPPFKDGEEA